MTKTTYNTPRTAATAAGLNSTRRYQPARYDHRDICNDATERANVRMQRERRGPNNCGRRDWLRRATLMADFFHRKAPADWILPLIAILALLAILYL